MSAPSTPPCFRRPVWAWIRPVLLAAFLLGVGWLLWRRGHDIAWTEVLASVRAYPPATLVLCAGLALSSLLLYSSFDLVGRSYTGHRLSTHTVMGVTFISYVFNLNLGALVGGFGFRLRLYSRLGLRPGQIGHILGLSMLTNWLGFLLLAGSLFALHPLPLPPAWPMGSLGLQALGVLLVVLGLAYVLLCALARRRRWSLRGHRIRLPRGRMALAQAVLGVGNWLLLGTLVHALMPAGLDWATVTSVLLLAAVAGVLTHVPAGLGVLEAVFLTLLAPRAPRHELLAALLTYRLMYYLLPLGLALALYLATELRARHTQPNAIRSG
jgi:uncharacterized membrane protein YbhN (UPF0104 family)